MARPVADAAILLGALEDAEPDPQDPVKACLPPADRDYTRFLDRDALAGARIGIPRAFYYERITPPGLKEARGGLNAEQAKAMSDAIAVLKERGAIIVDPADIPSVVDKDASRNFLRWEVCRGTDGPKGADAGCSVVFKYGMKRDFNKWLASLGPAAPVKSLTELRHWNLAHAKAGALKYGQSQLDNSDEMDVEGDPPRYQIDRAKDIALSGAHGIDAVMAAERLHALLLSARSRGLPPAPAGHSNLTPSLCHVA